MVDITRQRSVSLPGLRVATLFNIILIIPEKVQQISKPIDGKAYSNITNLVI